MKQFNKVERISGIVFMAIMVVMFIPSKLQAQSKYKSEQVNLVISGTSTMHDWEEKANNVIVNADFSIQNGIIQSLNSGYVSVEAKSIKSKEGSMMDNRTYTALQADKYPNITFQVTKVVSVQNNNGITIIDVLGNLTIAGKTQNTDLKLACKTVNGTVELTTNKKIKMTDYGIKPPSFMFGALKLGNDVTLTIHVTLVKD
ncbi:MAG: YceI family protein [Sphingobacteriales bacterium]|uniref:YceI family protein n=1 Tax=Hydrotalea flava TaxID=714549 RepID=UPI0008374887|nr:YceI family protein [Hydrotalea flava]RTL49967.1 MAG: YceI family protein [Sphingobacteriales bacterium]